MAFSINQIVVCGKLGRDAETKYTPAGVAVTTFSVATEERYKDGDNWKGETTWHNVKLWKNDRLADSLLKGATVTVRGKQKHRQYEGKDGSKKTASEIVAEDVIVMGESGNDRSESKPQPRYQPPATSGLTLVEDDLPF